jgi:hypothetical protein
VTGSTAGDIQDIARLYDGFTTTAPQPLPDHECREEGCERPRYLGGLCKAHSDLYDHLLQSKRITRAYLVRPLKEGNRDRSDA